MEGDDAYLRIPASMELICIGEKPSLIQVYGQEYFENYEWTEMDLLPQAPYVPNWDPEEDQERLCVCGHPYHRHFDSYDEMKPIGCKYCPCLVPTLTDSYDIVGKYDKRPPTDLALTKTVRAESIARDNAAVERSEWDQISKIKIRRTGVPTWWERFVEWFFREIP